jgi:hypothetical protein
MSDRKPTWFRIPEEVLESDEAIAEFARAVWEAFSRAQAIEKQDPDGNQS